MDKQRKKKQKLNKDKQFGAQIKCGTFANDDDDRNELDSKECLNVVNCRIHISLKIWNITTIATDAVDVLTNLLQKKMPQMACTKQSNSQLVPR